MLLIWLGKLLCFVVMIVLGVILWVVFGMILGVGLVKVKMIGCLFIFLIIVGFRMFGLDKFRNRFVFLIMLFNVCRLFFCVKVVF